MPVENSPRKVQPRVGDATPPPRSPSPHMVVTHDPSFLGAGGSGPIVNSPRHHSPRPRWGSPSRMSGAVSPRHTASMPFGGALPPFHPAHPGSPRRVDPRDATQVFESRHELQRSVSRHGASGPRWPGDVPPPRMADVGGGGVAVGSPQRQQLLHTASMAYASSPSPPHAGGSGSVPSVRRGSPGPGGGRHREGSLSARSAQGPVLSSSSSLATSSSAYSAPSAQPQPFHRQERQPPAATSVLPPQHRSTDSQWRDQGEPEEEREEKEEEAAKQPARGRGGAKHQPHLTSTSSTLSSSSSSTSSSSSSSAAAITIAAASVSSLTARVARVEEKIKEVRVYVKAFVRAEDNRRRNAARVIQAVWRGYRARCALPAALRPLPRQTERALREAAQRRADNAAFRLGYVTSRWHRARLLDRFPPLSHVVDVLHSRADEGRRGGKHRFGAEIPATIRVACARFFFFLFFFFFFLFFCFFLSSLISPALPSSLPR
jgi:hypothetical protein